MRIPVDHDPVDNTWMVRDDRGQQRELLERYDVVLVTDVDEIVAPDPRGERSAQYIDRFDEEFVNCLGYEILHLSDREPRFDPIGRCSSSGATGSRTTATTSRRWPPADELGARIPHARRRAAATSTRTCA